MRHYFSVSIRIKMVASFFQFGAQVFMIFNDAVVNDSNGASVIHVWMSILVVWYTVCGPACMTDTNFCGRLCFSQQSF